MRTIIIVLCCFILLVLSVEAGSQTLGAALNISGNAQPTILGTNRSPTAADISQDILFYVEAYDPDSDPMIAYCQVVNGSTNYGNVINKSILENVSTNVCNVSSTITVPNEQWHADIWVGDGTDNTTASSTLSSSVGSFVSNIANSSHVNLTITITFDTAININYTILYNQYNDSTDLNESVSNETYGTSHTIILSINPNETFYFNISTYTQVSNANEIWGIYSLDYLCLENWDCTDWSACVGGYQTRTCTDQNSCGTFDNNPAENQTCEEPQGGGGGGDREVEAPRPEFLLAGEPSTCGNGIVDEGETALNCNRDIKPTISDYITCIAAGKGECVYYDSYAAIALTLGVFMGIGGYFFFTPGAAGAASGALRFSRKRRKRKVTDWSKIKF